MKALQGASAKVRMVEATRDREAKELAKRVGCAPELSQLCAVLPPEEGRILRQAGDQVALAVRKLKAEMQVLSRLVEEQSALQQLMINEWRRFEGDMPVMGSGFDFRG